MKSALLAGAVALSLLGSPIASAEPASRLVNLFAQNAALGNEFSIEESKIILETSSNPYVRAFAAELLYDQSIAQAELDRLGGIVGVDTRIDFDSSLKKLVDDIGVMGSPKLDKIYLSDQSKAHARAVALLSDYAATGEDPHFRAYARAVLPSVLIHQGEISELSGKKPHL
jgi:putative membrane protein